MALKSLAEIAFDGFQCFADYSERYPAWRTREQNVSYKIKWDELTIEERLVWERVADRVFAEIALRMYDGDNPLPTVDEEKKP
jgi:hypothetical protein